ncbi:DUF397 domain-containing protein [Streptomyces sp. NBC_01754]|uniref:DUF397 domain-containing protein n=1 Tax=Streptomyces sp. NBC_01754 TaxID=2975930 RepID=UPI002DD7DE5A|nr:DUF397 domain-containing protein [Streptomyces sp. NBC_01754]WSC93017.1 DUF397 domain-containing protein [Streptomyces sp. NBC_01754]
MKIQDASVLPLAWWKSSYSDTGAQCVECGVVDTTTVAVRDSKNPTGPALLLGRDALAAMVGAVAAGTL